jgi:[ribosomal protein S5]-alanine N-acetyltransferase
MLPLSYTLRTQRLKLRAFTPSDAARVVDIQANWHVSRMLRMASYPPSRRAIDAWLQEHAEEWRAGTAYRFAVECDGALIGCSDVDEITPQAGSLGYWLDEPFWGRGFASESAGALVRFCFDLLGLPRLVSGHASDNPASGHVLTKLGFRLIGEERRWSRARNVEITQRVYELHRH